jgi:uncharacterized protein
MKTVEWVVKASKFCNLRCAYCYEWNSLGDRERISIDGWRHVLEAVRRYHLTVQQRLLRPAESLVIWHGGEPLTLPVRYLDEVMTLQHSMLEGLAHRMLLQTNLYHVPDAMLELLTRHRVGLGVSMDVMGGARVDRRGKETEAAVVANLDRLERRGIPHGAITVVAKHNYRRLRDVHDFWSRRRVPFRVLPLFAGPPERPTGVFEVSDDQLVEALNDLFDHWIGAGAVIDVLPLSEWLTNVVRKILGQRVPVYDRRRDGESVFLVETNGDLYQTDERGRPELRLGTVTTGSIDHILASDAYEASLRRTAAKTARFCRHCRHYGFCNGYPVHANPFEAAPAEACPITAAVHDHIEHSLLAAGYDARTLTRLIRAPLRRHDADRPLDHPP